MIRLVCFTSTDLCTGSLHKINREKRLHVPKKIKYGSKEKLNDQKIHINPFMHNVVKWPNVMHERVKHFYIS